MFRQNRLCRKCRTTITAFIFVDSKMLVQMFFVMSRLDISVRTILTIIHFIIVDTHVFIQWMLTLKSRQTIWFRALVPKIILRSLCMHLYIMRIQMSLNMLMKIIEIKNSISPLKQLHNHNDRHCMDSLRICAHLSYDSSILHYQS